MTTRTDWLEDARNKGATHLLVVCDTFSYEDYPVPVMPGEDLEAVKARYNKNMQRVEGIYDLTLMGKD